MSRYNNYGNGKNNRGVAAIIAIVLAAIVAFGAIFWDHIVIIWDDITRYFQRVDNELKDDSSTETPGDSSSTETPGEDSSGEETPGEDSSGNGGADIVDKQDGNVVVGKPNNNGLALLSAVIPASDYTDYGVAATAESAYSIGVTIEPSNVTYNAVDWAITWKNASSTWAKGKTVTDYVTLVPTSDGSTTATLSCVQAFGEQVVISATMREHPEVSTTATVDYVKRVTDITATISASELALDTTYTYTVTPTYGVGTLTGDFVLSDYAFNLTTGFKDLIESKLEARNTTLLKYTDYFSFTLYNHITVDENAKTFTFNGDTAFDIFGLYTNPGNVIDPDSSTKVVTSAMLRNAFNNDFFAAVGEYTDTQATFTADYTYTYKGTTYSSGDVTVNCKFDQESLVIAPISVTFNKTEYVF